MTWFKVCDSFHAHTKVVELTSTVAGREAIGLWVVAGSWCGDQLTDGIVSIKFVSRFGFKPKHARLLVRAGLWSEKEDGYVFSDWDQYQPLKAQVLEKREKDRRKKGRARAGASGLSHGDNTGDKPGDKPGDSTGDRQGDGPGDPGTGRDGTGSGSWKEQESGISPREEWPDIKPGDQLDPCRDCGSPMYVKSTRDGRMWAPCSNRNCDNKIPQISGRRVRSAAKTSRPKPKLSERFLAARAKLDELRRAGKIGHGSEAQKHALKMLETVEPGGLWHHWMTGEERMIATSGKP